MNEITGKNSKPIYHKGFKGMFDVLDNAIISPTNFMVNCHECGKVVCPVDAKLQATNKCDYYNGIWSRLFIFVELDRSNLCDHILKSSFIWMYDNPDSNFGKITKEEECG